MNVVGVDGCPDGWVAALADLTGGQLEFSVHPTIAALVEAFPDAVAIRVDIPIGLLFSGPRKADVFARKLMPGKSSSVFLASHPAIRYGREYRNAVEVSRHVHGKGLSQQGFAILPKIAEVDDYLTPECQERIFEVHPEVSFTALNGGTTIKSRKSRDEDFRERHALLVAKSGLLPIPTMRLSRRAPRDGLSKGKRLGYPQNPRSGFES